MRYTESKVTDCWINHGNFVNFISGLTYSTATAKIFVQNS